MKHFGWLPDPPDHRDWKVRHPQVKARLAAVLPRLEAPANGAQAPVPAGVGRMRVDLRRWCSPIEDQGDIGSCTAQATVGALEYFEMKTRRTHVDASRLFLYKVTRRYLGWTGDSGAFLRSAIKALRLFGACPEAFWPYDPRRLDAEPEPFHYALAQNFKAIEYFRLDGTPDQLRSALDSGLPFVFGFTCFSSLASPETARTGVIPFPGPGESIVGGHAVLAVGYGDSHILIRNSWGPGWGQKGYGFLPWNYFDASHPLAEDAWALVNASWVTLDDGEGVAGSTGLARRRSRSPRNGAASSNGRRVAAPGARGPLLKVAMGEDPVRAVPLRFTSRGITPAGDWAPALPVTPGPVSLSLRALCLNASFDVSLFRRPVNEVYFTALAWDLSGRPPAIYPPAGDATPPEIHPIRSGERLTFLGEGVLLWPSRPVTGALYTRILIFESDGGLRAVGRSLLAIRKAIEESPLLGALAALASGAISGDALAAVGAAVELTVGAVADLLSREGDDLVELFDGAYGADRALGPRLESYDHAGASIELEIRGQKTPERNSPRRH
jgi:papain like protease